MAVVKGVKERVHLPIYDSLSVGPGEQLRDVEATGVFKFFVNVQGKTKLQTNLQSASLLPHYNTFEARALRVVISDLPAALGEDKVEAKDLPVVAVDDEGDWPVDFQGRLEGDTGFDENKLVSADVEFTAERLWRALEEARESDDGRAEVLPDEDESQGAKVTLHADLGSGEEIDEEAVVDLGAIWLTKTEIIDLIFQLPERKVPPKEQLRPNNGAGTLISKLVYNTVTSFFVGEKVMIQMPTWFFPAGAGPYSETSPVITHGEPSPMATFRFAEPIFIDRQQNFRVEIEIPDADRLKEIQRLYGPFHLWVVLDGFMTRDVQ